MDSRDFHQEPKEITDGKYLEEIYSLQKQLIDGYVKIEGLPPYPLDVNTKKSQTLIKDFVGRVIEELAEGYESLLQVQELTEANYSWAIKLDNDKFTQCLNHLQNAGEEMADAMHFMTELLIYCNIQPEDIKSYILKNYPNSDKVQRLTSDNVIALAMIQGLAYIKETLDGFLPEEKNLVDLIQIYENLDQEEDMPIMDTRLLTCGYMYNPQLYLMFRNMMWDVTYHLNIARNFLKNKPWKQSQMMTNEIGFQEEIVKGFISLMGLFLMMGITDTNLYFMYFRKNLVNKFRQKSNY